MKVQLKPQRRNPDRTSVYINGRYGFSVDKETLVGLNLFEQSEISQTELDKLIYDAEKRKAKDYAFRLLTYRMRAKKEMENRLRKRAYPDRVIQDIMNELETLRLIDDKKFAQAFTQDRMNLGHKGKRLIFAELLKKGIDTIDIKTTFSEINGTQEEEACKSLIEKYQGRYKKFTPSERKQKLYALLTRRGFSYSIIKEVLKIEDRNS